MFIKGVVEYADRHGGWSLTTARHARRPAETAPTVRRPSGLAQATGCWRRSTVPPRWWRQSDWASPWSNISGALQHPNLPRVMADQYAIGRVGRGASLEHGHHTGLLRSCRAVVLPAAIAGLRGRAEQAGGPLPYFEPGIEVRSGASWRRRARPLGPLAERARPPVGLLAVQDYRARVVLDVCLQLGLNVPRNVAILGVDDDRTVCANSATPRSAAWRMALSQMGYEAAALLDRLMLGKFAAPAGHSHCSRGSRGTSINLHGGRQRSARGRGRAIHVRSCRRVVQYRAGHEAQNLPPQVRNAFSGCWAARRWTTYAACT